MRLPLGTLQRVEAAAQLAQGKGWGAATVDSEVAAALSLLSSGNRHGLTAVDVGANVGTWTAALLTALPTATVHAFEPSWTAFNSLESRLGHEPNVVLHRTAVGSTEGIAVLWADVAGSGLASLQRRRLDHFGKTFAVSEEVPVLTLDSWATSSGVTPQLLKMDVEGRELDVLAGATKMLRSVMVIQFEFGGCNIDTRTFFQDFWYFFKDSGFTLHRLGPRGLAHVNSYSELDECFITTNYFAVRND
jgi:FkbM family methyltransferase